MMLARKSKVTMAAPMQSVMAEILSSQYLHFFANAMPWQEALAFSEGMLSIAFGACATAGDMLIG